MNQRPLSSRHILGCLQHYLARRRWAVKLATKLRNQCQRVIAYHLSPGPEFDRNGEEWLINNLAPSVRHYVEVGANIGQWSSAMLERLPADALGLVFEPGRSMAGTLRERLATDPRLEVVEAACGDMAGQIAFHEGHECAETSGLVPEFTAEQGIKVTYPVRITRVDNEVEARGWPSIDFLKIDAEGWDLACLRGADRLFAAGKVQAVQFEYGPGWVYAGSTLAAAIRFLRNHQYTLYLLQPDCLVSYDYHRYGEHFSYSNFVAIAPNASGHVRQLKKGT